MKVTAVVPNYNTPASLRPLLRQLSEDTFDQIIVLDDGSHSFKTPHHLEAEFPSVLFHYGKENLGSGGNRNRVLGLIDEGIIWFIDNDMEIMSDNNALKLRKMFKHAPRQLVGGLMYAKSNKQMDWNYGHEMHPVHDARFEELLMSLENGDSSAWKRLKHHGWDYAWLRSETEKLTNRTVDWVAEGSFALPVELFREVGGYDLSFRYHEGQDLARRIRDTGARVMVTSDIMTRHLENQSHSRAKRSQDIAAARSLFFKKHWHMPRDIYEALYK